MVFFQPINNKTKPIATWRNRVFPRLAPAVCLGLLYLKWLASHEYTLVLALSQVVFPEKRR